MKKLFKTGLIAGGLTTLMASVALAAEDTLGSGTPLGNISSNVTNFSSLIKLLLQIAVAAAILWTLFNLIKAGIVYTGAGADAGKKKEAIGSVISAVVGLVIVLLSLVILYFVGGFVGVNPDTAVSTINALGPCKISGSNTQGVKTRCVGNSCATDGSKDSSDSANTTLYCKILNADGKGYTYTAIQ